MFRSILIQALVCQKLRPCLHDVQTFMYRTAETVLTSELFESGQSRLYRPGIVPTVFRIVFFCVSIWIKNVFFRNDAMFMRIILETTNEKKIFFWKERVQKTFCSNYPQHKKSVFGLFFGVSVSK